MSLKITDVSLADDFFAVIEEFKSEVAGKSLAAPKVNKEPGITAIGRVLAATMLSNLGENKVTMHKYRVIITGLFKPDDVPPNVGIWTAPNLVETYRFESHLMNESEKREFTSGGKTLGRRQYSITSPQVNDDGTPVLIQFATPQFLEVTSFDEWAINGRNVRAGDEIKMCNLRWEDKTSAKKTSSGVKCENVSAAMHLAEFEKLEGLSAIAPGTNQFVCLWHNDETANMPVPARITDAMRYVAADDTMKMMHLEEEKRRCQSTPLQRQVFSTSLCIPLQESSPQSALTRYFLKFYSKPTFKAEEGQSQREVGGVYARIEASLFVMQMTPDRKREKIAVHVDFDREAVNSIGVHNNVVKKKLVPLMLKSMRDGRMWCTVNIVQSTKHQEVPRDEEGNALADYSLYLRCQHVSFSRPAMIRATSLPITPLFAKQLHSSGGQPDIRKAFSPEQSLRPGMDVYNASEFESPLDPENYDYYLMAMQLTELNIRQFEKMSAEKNWTPEQAREEVSKYLSGKNTLFSEFFTAPEFGHKEPAVIWGIKKGLVEPAVEDEAKLLERYLQWQKAPAATPLLAAPQTVQVEELETDASDASESKRNRQGKASNAKRNKRQMKD